ncbi:MAG TPA: glycosyltransferase family 4 protein [Candidatus Methanoperedens sp.]|nr:glycosyltransferase family 4 protein [Candidatus Methanoperedens sp.]
MTSFRIDQVVPSFTVGDAIGNDALALREILRRRGVTSEIFVRAAHASLRDESRPWSEYAAVDAPGNVCLLHFSIGTPLADEFARLRAHRALIYHNITPPALARGVNPLMEHECRLGREQLRRLAACTELGIGVSEYNRRELEEAGFASTAVIPIVVDFADHERQEPAPEITARWRDGRTNVLHVGRFAPNKRLEDVVRAFHLYQRLDPHSRLLLVGSSVGLDNYAAAVRGLALRLGNAGVRSVGAVGFRELCTYYRLADVYLALSEHEGFCVPLLEAMHFGVPIVARAAGAIPETLGGAGLLVEGGRFAAAAALMRLAVADRKVRAGLIAAGRARLADFAPEKIARDFWELLKRHGLAGR